MPTAHITLSWNLSRLEETKVNFSAEYQELSTVEKLDFLKDAMWDLQNSYFALLNAFINKKSDVNK